MTYRMLSRYGTALPRIQGPPDSSATTDVVMMANQKQGEKVLNDALQQLRGWVNDDTRLIRELPIDESQHAALKERIKIVSDTLGVRPDVTRQSGVTHIEVSRPDGVNANDVTFAGRIEDAYRVIAGDDFPVSDQALGRQGTRSGFGRWYKRD